MHKITNGFVWVGVSDVGLLWVDGMTKYALV